jgi:DNA-damage-inducible protein D
MKKDKIIVFKGKNIRRIWHNDEWWFSIIDVVGVLTNSSRPRKYWADLKKKLLIEEGCAQIVRKNRTTEVKSR